MPIPPLPLITAGIDLLGGIFGNAQQNKYNEEMWNKQNEYNSPKNQMKRYEEAGLNPQLIYGQGTPGNASAVQSKTAYSPDTSKALNSAVQIQQLTQTVENLKTNQELIAANQRLKEQETELKEKQTQWYDALSSSRVNFTNRSANMIPAKEAVLYSQAGKLGSSAALDQQRMSYMAAENVRQNTTTAARANQMQAQTALANQQRLSEIFKTDKLKWESKVSPQMVQAILDQHRAATQSLLQGASTSKSQQSLNAANEALREIQANGYVSDRVLRLLESIIKFK